LYGTIAFSTAVLIYLSRVVDGGIDLGIGVREMAAHPDATILRAPAIITLRLVIALVLAGVVAVTAILLLPYPDNVVLALFGLTLIPVGASSRWILVGMERTGVVAAARAAGEAVMVLLVVSLVRSRADLFFAPISQFIGDALAGALLLWWVARQGIHLRLSVDWDAVRPLVGRALPLVGSALLGLLIYNSDLIFLRFLRDRESVGLYAVAYTLVSFIANIGAAYFLTLLPGLTRTTERDSEHRDVYHTATAHVFAVGFPIAVGGSLLSPQVIDTIFGSGYSHSAAALRVLVWAIPVSLLRDVPVTALLARGREDRILRLTALAASLSIVLNLALIPPFGLIGAAVATVLTETVRMIVAMVSVQAYGISVTAVNRLWKPTAAAAVMALLLILISPQTLWIAVVMGGGGYLATLGLLGGISLRRGGLPTLNV
jgi:O-antigen/teichoic acid export membrane protein